jgi:hypothetical protein
MMNCKKNRKNKLIEKRLFWSLVFSFIIHHSSFSQIGSWQSHVSYLSGRSVAVVHNKVYASTQNGFFCYNKSTNETTILGKQQGLSDVGISRLLYLADQNRLLIAYQNGNLDFLTLSATGEIAGVKNLNTIIVSRQNSNLILHLNRIDNYVYISTNYGISVLDITKDEIRDTYFTIRSDGVAISVYATAAANDSLYALTDPAGVLENGYRLRAIRLSPNVNIADPANWRSVAEPGVQMQSLVSIQGRLLTSVSQQGVYSRQNGQWILNQLLTNSTIRLFSSPNGLITATNKAVTAPASGTFTGSLLADPREVIADGNQVWVADGQNGLLLGNAGIFQRIAPDGPTSDLFPRLYTYPQTLVALPSDPQSFSQLTSTQPPFELLSVPANRWLSSLGSAANRSFNSAVYIPTEQKLYLSSYGDGLWSQTDGQLPTPVILPATINSFITSLATDYDGNLWITTASSNTSQPVLHVRRPDGQFQSLAITSQNAVYRAVPDDNGFIWLQLSPGGGLLVVDPQTNRGRLLTTTPGQGGLLSNTIRALVKDRNGVIWVGTDLGPMVFDNPAGAFDAAVDAQSPIINRRRLLANEQINAIAVDGGNRKWIGTQSGIYYVSPDGSQLLETFTASNSPLPNNVIKALAIEPISGKLFISTDNGLISYQSSATEPAETLTGLTIFPNPVRPDFTGTVGINGLTENSTVKILDAGGQLVYETRSQGGMATWNLRDYRGRQAQTGIYLVVVVSSDGSEGLAGKLAVVR